MPDAAAYSQDRRELCPPSIERWGRVDYQDAWRRQLRICQALRAGACGDTLVVCEHPATITLGRHAPTSDVLLGPAECRGRGITVVRSDRGGRATYHGPGQLVVYPIIDLANHGLGPCAWVEMLEEALIATIAAHGLRGERRRGRPGIWVGGAKIASIGLRIARGISYHGVSLNCDLDVGAFDCIVACGAAAGRMTSLAAENARTPSVDAAATTLIAELSRRLVDTSGART